MNFDRGMNPASKLTRRTFFSFVDKVEAVDPLTVRFTLKQPTAGFIARLSNLKVVQNRHDTQVKMTF